MSLSPAYIPTHGTLPDRVVEWFNANPDEELTLADLAVKFDVSQALASVELAAPVLNGRLQLARSGPDRTRVYRLGSPQAVWIGVDFAIAPAMATGDLMFSISPDRCIAVSFFVPGLIDPRRVLAAMLETAATTIGKQP